MYKKQRLKIVTKPHDGIISASDVQIFDGAGRNLTESLFITKVDISIRPGRLVTATLTLHNVDLDIAEVETL